MKEEEKVNKRIKFFDEGAGYLRFFRGKYKLDTVAERLRRIISRFNLSRN